jgi:hypothetical protein
LKKVRIMYDCTLTNTMMPRHVDVVLCNQHFLSMHYTQLFT